MKRKGLHVTGKKEKFSGVFGKSFSKENVLKRARNWFDETVEGCRSFERQEKPGERAKVLFPEKKCYRRGGGGGGGEEIIF